MRYTKMHGAGNSFLLTESLHGELQGEDLSGLALRLCDARTGPGADGLIVLVPAAEADFGMLFYNADGSLGEMCGNGARCLARYGVEHGQRGSLSFSVVNYQNNNPDLVDQYADEYVKYYVEYVKSGHDEGRDGSVSDEQNDAEQKRAAEEAEWQEYLDSIGMTQEEYNEYIAEKNASGDDSSDEDASGDSSQEDDSPDENTSATDDSED